MKPQQQTILAESLIPNSLASKKTELQKAKEVLLKAKLLDRTVRKAESNECDFSREIKLKKENNNKPIQIRDDGMITASDAKRVYGISEFNIQDKRKKGLINFKYENRRYYYYIEEIKNLQTYKNNNNETDK